MGWFSKKNSPEMKTPMGVPPQLPKLPELPDLPPFNKKEKESLHQLPQFPNNSIGEKFSKNTIKEAVSGSRDKYDYPEEEKGDKAYADDFELDKERMMRKPQKKLTSPITREIDENEDYKDNYKKEEDLELEEDDLNEINFEEPKMHTSRKSSKKEPVFIRIDKFEESMKTFEKTKKEIAEIEKMLKDIQKIKDQEEKELESWSNSIVKIKDQVAKVDEDIFSKIE